MTQGLVSLLVFASLAFSNQPNLISPLVEPLAAREEQEEVLALKSLDLTNRYENDFVNDVFKYNILLAVDNIGESFILQPGEVFAFHDNVLAEFKNGVVKTTNSHFMADEGYKSSGFIVGDGVCHLASLMNWAASEAGLEVVAKVDHNFRLIPDIPKEYGTSIRYSQSGHNSQNQNLYIKNNKDFAIEFKFRVEENSLELAVIKK